MSLGTFLFGVACGVGLVVGGLCALLLVDVPPSPGEAWMPPHNEV